jgi:hypothetical protein
MQTVLVTCRVRRTRLGGGGNYGMCIFRRFGPWPNHNLGSIITIEFEQGMPQNYREA